MTAQVSFLDGIVHKQNHGLIGHKTTTDIGISLSA